MAPEDPGAKDGAEEDPREVGTWNSWDGIYFPSLE